MQSGRGQAGLRRWIRGRGARTFGGRVKGWVLAGAWVLLAIPALAQPDGDVRVYLTVEQALKEVFPSSKDYITERITLSAKELQAAQAFLRRKNLDSTFEAVLAYGEKGQFLGYAVITEEIGKYRPITFIVGVTPKFRVKKVAVMVYRESRGGEVRMPRFLYQYRGKAADDPIRINRDIINVSGATISVRALNAGVRKVLYLVRQRYVRNPPQPTFSAERATISKNLDRD